MAYDLSFAPDFFLAEGEPYDLSDLALNDSGEPVSVWSAICMMREGAPEDWASLAREVFDCESERLTPEMVLDRIRETNTCGTLRSPVDVWVDAEGWHRVYVHEE